MKRLLKIIENREEEISAMKKKDFVNKLCMMSGDSFTISKLAIIPADISLQKISKTEAMKDLGISSININQSLIKRYSERIIIVKINYMRLEEGILTIIILIRITQK